MTWTYTGDPTSSAKDEIRFLIGDTVAADKLVQDEEIAYCLVQEPNHMLAAALACEAIAALYSRLADSSAGPVSQSMSQKSAQYVARGNQLRRRAGIAAGITAGGITRSEHNAISADTDAVQPVFSKGQDDIPGTPNGMTPAISTDPFFEGF